MRILNILLLLIVGFLWMAPGAFAFFPGEERGAEESKMIDAIQLRKAYHEMIEERKKLIKEAAPAREKRKAILTPFVYDTPQEFADLERWQKTNEAERKASSKIPSKSPPPASPKDVNKEVLTNILMSLIIIVVFITGMILLSKYLRPKK